ERPKARIVLKRGRTLGPRRLQHVARLVEQLPREKATLVRGASEGKPGEGGQMGGCCDRHDEEDDEGEAEQLPRPRPQGHDGSGLGDRTGAAITATGYTGSACCGGS